MKKLNKSLTKYVAYYRVSTAGQGKSGLGLASQKSIVQNFIKSQPVRGRLIAEFREVQSGKDNERVVLRKAINCANENQARLIIAKLDRLSRNVKFIFELKDSKVDFVAADIPEANTMTIGIIALLAQYERELISERTRRALQELKKRGVKLGKPKNLTEKSRLKSIKARRLLANTDINNLKAIALIESMRSQKKTYRQIAEKLNQNGYKTRFNNRFYGMSVKQLFDRSKGH